MFGFDCYPIENNFYRHLDFLKEKLLTINLHNYCKKIKILVELILGANEIQNPRNLPYLKYFITIGASTFGPEITDYIIIQTKLF